ncbi:MAG: hypothetical protein K1X28_10450 [Parachlamydiales bacterium]|nr:hypothetical protein [Parachlamydiales bacterium]
MKRISLLGVILLVLFWGIREYSPIFVSIKGVVPQENICIRMPLKDRKRLEYFFRNACFLNGWAYTLLGSKPMSTHQYVNPLAQFRRLSAYTFTHLSEFPRNFREICYLLNPEQFRIKSGWETLNKYMHLFPESRFAIFTHRRAQDIVCLTLIDKVKLANIVKLYTEDFREIFHELNVDPEELYHNETLGQFLDKLHEDRLIGIVLGFGKNNAALYQEYRKKNLPDWPMVSMWAEEDAQHLQNIHEKNLSFESWDITDLFYPYFACKPESEESKFLKTTYRKEREEIIKYYEGKDIVEATLSLFNQKTTP